MKKLDKAFKAVYEAIEKRKVKEMKHKYTLDLYKALKQIIWKVDQTQGYKEMREDAVIHLAKQALAKVEGKKTP